eukprot:5117124-Prymnesium_polylepis.2
MPPTSFPHTHQHLSIWSVDLVHWRARHHHLFGLAHEPRFVLDRSLARLVGCPIPERAAGSRAGPGAGPGSSGSRR